MKKLNRYTLVVKSGNDIGCIALAKSVEARLMRGLEQTKVKEPYVSVTVSRTFDACNEVLLQVQTFVKDKDMWAVMTDWLSETPVMPPYLVMTLLWFR